MPEHEFEFSMRGALKRAWGIFKKHVLFFLLISVVMVIFNIFSNQSDSHIVKALIAVAGIVWSYVNLSIAIAAVDGKEGMLSFDALRLHLPSFRQFLRLLGIAILSALIIGAGLVALIIPGIYFMVRLMFANYVLVDKRQGVIASMKASWRMVKGDIFWTVFLALIVFFALVFGGMLIALIGILITYPIAVLFMAILYRELSKFASATEVVVQPKELPPQGPEPTPATEPNA